MGVSRQNRRQCHGPVGTFVLDHQQLDTFSAGVLLANHLGLGQTPTIELELI